MSDFREIGQAEVALDGGGRLPVLGAAGGNVGVAVHANRRAHKVSAKGVNAARRSHPVTFSPLPCDNPERLQ